jgi:Ca2+-binding RTX toxin-like protein
MLGMFGLFGALLAGLVADSMIGGLMSKADGHDDDAPPDSAGKPDDVSNGPDLLDWDGAGATPEAASATAQDGAEDVPSSSDVVPEADPALALTGGSSDEILTGLGGDDTLIGGAGDDQLTGRDGDDLLQGGDGSDVAQGGAGADTAQGGAGDDLLVGGSDDDRLVGGAGADTLLGQEGADGLFGGAGADTLIGGGGDDNLVGGDADDWLAGGLGNDSLVGDAGSDTLDGGAGHDALDGRESVNAFPEMDFLNGGDGDDTLMLGAGDYATGGDGADWFELSDLMPGDAIANIADYNAHEDSLVVVFDPMMHPDPQLSLETPADSDDVVVLLDGVPLALVQGGAGMTLGDVLLTPAQAA